jgi:hypothetical protein
MKTATACLFVAAVISVVASAPAQSGLPAKNPNLPPAFTENRGQWDEKVMFRANAGDATIWLTNDGIYYQFTRRTLQSDDPLNHVRTSGNPQKPGSATLAMEDVDPPRRQMSTNSSESFEGFTWAESHNHVSDSVEQLMVQASFVGANENVEIVGEGRMEYRCNYFIGNDPAKWRTDVPNYSSVTLRDVYDGVDLCFYGSAGGNLTYEYLIAPGADVDRVRLEYEGLQELSVDDTGKMTA